MMSNCTLATVFQIQTGAQRQNRLSAADFNATRRSMRLCHVVPLYVRKRIKKQNPLSLSYMFQILVRITNKLVYIEFSMNKIIFLKIEFNKWGAFRFRLYATSGHIHWVMFRGSVLVICIEGIYCFFLFKCCVKFLADGLCFEFFFSMWVNVVEFSQVIILHQEYSQ